MQCSLSLTSHFCWRGGEGGGKEGREGPRKKEAMEREGGNEGSQKGRRRERKEGEGGRRRREKEGEEGTFCVPFFLSCWGEP